MGNSDKKQEAKIFYDIDSWLKSAIGQNALKHDNLNTIRELGFKQEAETGKAIHNLEKGLREVAAWAQSNYNLYPEIKSLPGNKGAKIVFRPRGTDAKNIQDADCPFIEITKTGQNGSYTIRDGILSPNSPILVRGSNGEVGLASVMSTEIAQILDDWKENDMRIRQQLSKNKAEGLKYLKRMTSRSVSSVKQLTAGVYSTHQIKEYTELNDKSVNNLRPEALWAMMSQVLTGHYARQLYNANSAKRGAPTLQQFQRDIDNIMDASRGLKTAQQISNYVKQHYGWIYQNVWKGDFENVFNSFAGKMSQSGMTEGTKGKFGLMEVEAALKAFQAPGKKLKQNAQVLPQKTSFLHGKALAATGMTSVMSKNQLAKIRQGIKNGFMSNNDIYKDVYTTAMFSKQDLENAKKELKRLYSARKTDTGAKEILERYGLSVKQFEKQYDKSVDMMLKGFGADASFMGVDLARDLRGVRDPKHLKDGFITFDELNNYVRDSILESKQRKLERLKKDPHGKNAAQKIDQINKEIAEFSKDGINVLEKEASGKFKYGQYGVFDKLQNYVRKIYDLDNTYKINNNFKFQDGLLTNLVATRARHNDTAVFRAGLTADERTTKSMMSNLLMAESMYQAKYNPEDIFRDTTQKLSNGGGLKAQNFIESAPLSNKNIRSRIMQVLTHVDSELRDQRKMQGEDIAKIFKEDEFFGKFFKEKGKNAIFSIDKETGMLLVDNDALEARLDAKHKNDSEMATNMLLAAVRVGQMAGVYDPNVEYFKKRRGAGTTWLTQEAPILLKEELGLSSSPEWMNLGRAGGTRSRIGINEMRSLEATYGEFGQWLLDQGYTSGNKNKDKDYDVAIAPIRNYVNAVRDKMEDNKAKYHKYVENADYLAKNFSTEASQFRQDILDDMSVVKLDVNDLALMNFDMDYDAVDKGGMLIKDGDLQTSNLIGPYLARKRKERFEQIQALKKSKQWNDLSALDKSKYNAINSEDDLKMFALDFGNEHLSTEINGKVYDSRMMVLPIGSFDQDRANIYKPDEGLKTATSMLRSARDFLIHDGSFDRDKQAYFSTKNIIEQLKDWQKEITGGKTFEAAHEVTGGRGSGYLLLQGMTDNSEEILKDILGSKGNGANLNNVSRIISTTDLTEMLKAEIKEDESKVIDLYQSIFKKGPGKKSRDGIIKAMVDSVDISKRGKDGKRTWNGNILNNLWSNRNPTINFINDLVGGGLVASSNADLVAQGRMLINKHYAAIGKGDMDGDLVTLFDALNSGDFQTAGSALSDFFTHKREYQKEIQEEEAKADAKNLDAIKRNILRNNPQADVSNITNAGEIKKINSVLDKEEKDVTVAAAWLGKQGAGRYGNAKFSAEDIISSVVGTTNRQGNNITSFGARVFGAIIQSLYQKGINIKNLKRGSNGEILPLDEEAGKVYGQMLSTMDMVTGAGTWDDDDIRRSFFDRAEALGVFKNEAMFEGATLQTLGLDRITKKDQKFLSDLKSIAENTKFKLERQFGPNSAQVKTIEADIKQIAKVQSGKQKTITNLSKEFVNAIVGGDYSQSFARTVGRDGKSLGYQMSKTFEHIEGYSSSIGNLIPALGEVIGKGQYDEETLHKFANFFSTAQNNKQSNYLSELRLLEKYKGKYDIYTSPSSELKQFFVNDKEYIQSDDRIGKLAARYVSATTDEEREKIQREVNALAPEFRESSGAIDTIRGLIAHKVAEVLALDENKDMDISSWQTGKEALNLLDDKFINPYKAQLEFMSDTFKDPKTMEKFLLNAAQKGVGNTRLLRSTMQRTAGSGKAISLGSETPLLGYSAINEQGYHKKSYQTADTMWVTEDENGLTLHVGDFKNPKKDHVGIQNVIQLADEARSMEILSEHVQGLQQQGKFISDANAFFAQDTAIARDWKARLRHAAAKESGQTSGAEYQQAYEKFLQDFETKLKYAKQGFARTQGHLITSGNTGYSSVYDVRLSDPKLRQMFGAYLDPSKGLNNAIVYNSEAANEVLNSSVTRTGTYFTGTFEQAKSQLSGDAQKILERYEALQVVRAALTDLELKEQALRREISTPEREVAIEELKKQIEDKRTEYAEGLNSIQEDAKVLGGRAIYNDQGLQIEGVGKEAVLNPLNALITQTDSFYNLNKHNSEQRSYLDSLIKHLEQYETQAKRVADLEAKVKSPLLKGKNKRAARADARAELEQEKTNLEKLVTSIEEEKGGLDKDSEGQFINPYTYKPFDEDTSNALDLNRDIDKIYSKARKRAKQDRRVSDRGQIAAYEEAVLSYEKQRYHFEDEIAAKEEELSEAENEGLTEKVELLQLEIERLKEIKDLTLTRAKNDLDAMYGANSPSYKNMVRLQELLHEQEKNKKKPSAPQQQGGGGSGFMGIDSATSRWFERLANGGIIFTAIRLIRRGFHDLTNKAKQLDQAMTNLRIVTGKSADNARILIDNYAELGKELGATTVEVTAAATSWLRQGYDISQVNDLVTSSLYLSKLGMIDVATATQNMTSAMHGFQLEASQAMDIVDKLTALDVKAATTAGDIAQGLSQFANIARLGGVSIDQAAAYVATIADVNQMSGITVGQSLKTIMSRYGNVKAGAYNKLDVTNESNDTNEKLNDVERVLTKMGISIRKTNLEFKDFDEVLDEIAKKWGTLDNVSKRAIANAFAGVRQQEAFMILLENYDKYQDLLTVSENSKGTAERKYQSYKESFAFARNEFTAALEQIANSSELSKLLTDLTKVGTNILSLLQKYGKFIPNLIMEIMRFRIVMGKGLFNQGYETIMRRNLQGGGVSFSRWFRGSGKGAQSVQAEGGSAANAAPNKTMGSKAGTALAFAELGANILTTSLTQLKTAATTHQYNGETVESSTNAQKQGGAVSAAVSLIPFLGTFLGPLAGEAWASNVDRQRDIANAMTSRANKRLTKLQGLTSSLNAIGASEQGSVERHKLVQEFRREIFDKDNVELRKMLSRHLGNQNITTLLEQIDSNTAESSEALKTIQLAQIQAEKTQIYNKYASTLFENQKEINKIVAELDNVNSYDAGTGAAIVGGATAAGGATGVLAGAGIGASVGAAGGPIGAAAGALIGLIVGAISGLIGGSVANAAYQEAQADITKEAYQKLDWSAQNSIERIDTTKENIKATQDKIDELENGYDDLREQAIQELMRTNRWSRSLAIDMLNSRINRSTMPNSMTNLGGTSGLGDVESFISAQTDLADARKDLENYEKLLEALERQTTVEMQILNEMNDLTLQESLVASYITNGATGSKSYLSDMTISQLKNLGVDEILTVYGQAIEEAGGLHGMDVWTDASKTQLSEAGYDYLFEELRKQGDEEINAVLSGAAFTLEEALNLKGKGGYEVQRRLQAFADSLGVSVDALDQVVDKFGKLTLAETMLSPEEIISQVENLSGLLTSITSGAGSMSSWMQNIITQFPELIAYMGDIPTLFAEATERMDEFSNVFLKAQYDAIMSSEALFKSVQDELFNSITDDAAAALRENPALTKLSDIMTWVTGQYDSNGNLSEEAKNVVKAVQDIADEYGMKVVSNVLKNYYDQLITFRVKTIDTELSNLESQKTALSEIVHQREYENKLIEAKLKLEDASKQKKRIYRAGVGWVYESDQSAISSAQKDLDSLSTEKQISQIESRILALQGYKEELNNVYENQNYETLQQLYEEAVADGKVASETNSFISDIKSSVDGISQDLSEYIASQLALNKENKDKAVAEVKTAWETFNSSTPGTGAYNTSLQALHTAMTNAKNAGATKEDFKDFAEYASGDNPASRISTGQSVWDIATGDIDSQTVKIKSQFDVADPRNETQRFVGFTNGDMISTQVAKAIFDGLKDGNAIIWTDASTGFQVKNGSFQYAVTDSDTDLYSYFKRVSDITGQKRFLVSDPDGKNESIFYDNGQILKVVNNSGKKGYINGMQILKDQGGHQNLFDDPIEAAWGSMGFPRNSLGLINELGTEAIITPQGTLTALPSRTGIVPADITKNLWELGDVAPTLVRMLEGKIPGGVIGKSIFGDTLSDESFNVSNLVMNVTADSSFDVDKFVETIKTRVSLTKNNSK